MEAGAWPGWLWGVEPGSGLLSLGRGSPLPGPCGLLTGQAVQPRQLEEVALGRETDLRVVLSGVVLRGAHTCCLCPSVMVTSDRAGCCALTLERKRLSSNRRREGIGRPWPRRALWDQRGILPGSGGPSVS